MKTMSRRKEGQKMEYLAIGEMARINHISAQTLRLYEKIGLIFPDYINPENGYRYYSIRQSARLDIIQYMKSLGMTLSDIKKLLDRRDVSMLKALLEQKNGQIDQQIKELQYQKRAVARTLESYERYEKMPPEGTVSLEYIGKRYMYCVDSGINFYDYGIDTYEKILRKLKLNLMQNHLTQSYFHNAGTVLRQNYLEKREYRSSEVFVFVDREFPENDQVTTISPNTYLCVYCRKFEDEKRYIGKLLDSVQENRYRIVGDYICESLAELPVFEDNERSMSLRLQVPITFY